MLNILSFLDFEMEKKENILLLRSGFLAADLKK